MEPMSWLDGADPHAGFQLDVSCMLDGELDETAAARTMLHIEECTTCRSFFEDLRLQVRLHQDVGDPDRLFARVAMLTGGVLPGELLSAEGPFSADRMREEAEAADLVHRLATVFYQLGKAYVLAATDPDYRTRVFEAAVPLEETKLRGRGFVDGVLMNGREGTGGVDWTHARHMLNGRLERIESPAEKGRRLLEEAVEADPEHEEARLYLAFLHGREGRSLKAVEEYQEIFRSAVSEENRGHAAAQLGKLYVSQQMYRKALAYFRWLTIGGLARRDGRFFFAYFNIGKSYAMLGDKERALDAFRALLDAHPSRLSEIIEMFAKAEKLQRAIEEVEGFPEELLARCPELFAPCAAGSQEGRDESGTQGRDQAGPEEHYES